MWLECWFNLSPGYKVQVGPALFLPDGGGEGEVQVMRTRLVVSSTQGINARPRQLFIFFRVADPVQFLPDPDPANQNFKSGSGSCF